MPSGRVEERRGCLGHAATPRFPSSPINRTCGTTAFCFPTGFTVGHTAAVQGYASKMQHAQFSEHVSVGKASRTASLHLVPSRKKVSNAIIDMLVDRPICGQVRTVAEVSRPTEQKPVQLVAHLGPRPFLARYQDLADLGLDPLNTFLGRARAQIPMASFPIAVRAECVTKEIEALRSGVAQRGLLLIEYTAGLKFSVRPAFASRSICL